MLNLKEQQARLKINKLLAEAGWRLLDSEKGKANVSLEVNVKISVQEISSWGKDFETTKNGFIDFLLNDQNGFPLIVLEAKKESKNPLDGKEQARKYAENIKARFIILSNGNIHYFWDLKKGNPEIIIKFPTQESIEYRKKFKPDIDQLVNEMVDENYISESQLPNFQKDPQYLHETTRKTFLEDKDLHILRPYQLAAIHTLQKAAKRILFLVDRITLESQACKNFRTYLQTDFDSVIYKENQDDWKKAEIVVSTVQSLIHDNKYKQIFSPTDFDLLIADESHRAIGGNSRALFEYFIGYKLGLTATPKNYLKNINSDDLAKNDPRAWERRQLLDTYRTFHCKNGIATFQYDLTKAVQEDYLISPIVVDARTEITTELLSKKGYAILITDDEGNKNEQIFFQNNFERKFFSKKTNLVFVETFIENALKDPINGELGKSLIFCVSQNHASKITQILNQIATKIWPGKYNSDFAVQITSNTDNPQKNTINFANNNLQGHSIFKENYKTSRTRVCVTVAMMTTGYDCADILNIVMMRPIFSPVAFIQIKGRGTRKHSFKFENELKEKNSKAKKNFKLFDFFGNCEYFENEFIYDEILKLPFKNSSKADWQNAKINADKFETFIPDPLKTLTETFIGSEGMKIDKEYFKKVTNQIIKDENLKECYQNEEWEKAQLILNDQHVDCPELYITLEKIRYHEKLDRKITWKEVLTRVYSSTTKFKDKDCLLEEECEKFISIEKPPSNLIIEIKNFIKAYIVDPEFRKIIDQKHFSKLRVYGGFSMEEFEKLGINWMQIILDYINDYVNIAPYAN